MPMIRPDLPQVIGETVVQKTADMKETAQNTAENLIDRGKAAVSDILSSVGKVVDKYAPSLLAGMAGAQFRGTQGSFQSYNIPIRLSYRYMPVSPSRNDEIGRPYHAYRDMNTVTGFVLCENAKVPLTVSLTEQTAVEEFLNGGIFIE